VCDQFEEAWRSGQRPRLEDFLAQAPTGARDTVLVDLLAIELQSRSQAAEQLSLDEYCHRFPDHTAQVETLFRRLGALQRLGDYELLDQLGRGGMGEVYRARQVHLNQTVAIKLLPERYLAEPQAVARFRREMQSIGGLSHPNIVRAYNAGEAGGRHFLVMEYVEGVDLQRLVTAQGIPLGVGLACELVRQAAQGLQHAHEHGLVHRDIKPANLILNPSGVVKILDFGLARFDASQLTMQLSQEGMAIGTVDYMAPEQAENSSAVDIRADIYSLGCTLFFLLAGRPPYANKAYDSIRKKLMAHAVAPIPSLLDACPDCPEDLDNILGHMMAKEPDARFDTPGEVADAVGLFADPDALLAAEPTTRILARSAHTAMPRTSSGGHDTSKRTVRRSGSKRRSGSAWRRRPWYRRPWPLVALVGGLLLAVSLGVGWLVRGNGGKQPPRLPPERRELAADLASLPGLGGQWWFDEMPWYVPFIRQRIAENVDSAVPAEALQGNGARPHLEPNAGVVQKWLWEAATRCAAALPDHERVLLEELKSLSSTALADTALADELERSLRKFTERLPGKRASATDLHTQALIHHKLAALRNDRTAAEKAQTLYEAAQKRYGEVQNAAVSLQSLCLADWAILSSRVLNEYDEAKKQFSKALSPDDLPLLFAAETRIEYGSEAASAGKYEDRLFEEARTLLDKCGASKRNHPLTAHACERYAWSLMDQWKVEEAAKQFQEAYNIRLSNKRAEDPFAPLYVFHNQHGTAIALRYRGNTDGARDIFKTLVGDQVVAGGKGTVGEIQAALQEAKEEEDQPGQQRYLRDLTERWANSMERWADCELYGGAAFGLPVNLLRAAALYEKSSELNRDLDQGTRVVMGYKLCIVQTLHGRTAEARKLLAALQADTKDILGPDRERAELLRQVAEAVLKIKPNGAPPDEGRKALQGFLDQFKLHPTTDSSRRETLELQLFCAALLVSAELEAQQAEAANRDRRYLYPLLATFRGRQDMRPFLRGFYELAIRACDKSDLVSVAQYILESRAVGPPERLRSDRPALLLFQFTAQQNFALFLPQDGRPGRLFPLSLNREQIKNAASRGQTLRLDEELVKLVQAEIAARRPIEVSWADTMCWASEDEGLSDGEWPFGDQLDLALLRQASKNQPPLPGGKSTP
jgi:serine/threonine protein kinase